MGGQLSLARLQMKEKIFSNLLVKKFNISHMFFYHYLYFGFNLIWEARVK